MGIVPHQGESLTGKRSAAPHVLLKYQYLRWPPVDVLAEELLAQERLPGLGCAVGSMEPEPGRNPGANQPLRPFELGLVIIGAEAQSAEHQSVLLSPVRELAHFGGNTGVPGDLLILQALL